MFGVFFFSPAGAIGGVGMGMGVDGQWHYM